MIRNPGYELELPDRTIRLKLDWAAMAAAEDQGVDLLNGGMSRATGLATLLWACAAESQPEMTREDWLGILLRHGEACGLAVASLFARYGAPESADPAGEAEAADGATAKS